MKRHAPYVILIALCFLGAIVFPKQTFALDVVDVVLSPEVPGEYQDVEISLRSFTTDISSSMISWFVDGKAVVEGVGMSSFQTRTRGVGEEIRVNVIIVTPSGHRIDRELVLSPTEVDILWEANTTVPPFYRGKALPSPRGTVRVAAFPRFNTKSSDPSQYLYEWSYDISKKVAGGLGKSSAVVPSLREGVRTRVSVKVLSQDRSKSGTGMLMFPTVAPRVVIYERDPLYGVRLDRPLGSEGISTKNDGVFLRSYPLYFSENDRSLGKFKIFWFIDDYRAPNWTDKNEIYLSKAEGASSATVRYENSANILQQAFLRVPITFTN
jgi:hypothetical protein